MTDTTNIRDAFTVAEWNQLSYAPIAAAAAMSMSDKTGSSSVMRELTAAAKAYTAGFTPSSGTLVPALSKSLTQESLSNLQPAKGVDHNQFAADLRLNSLNGLNKAVTLISEKATPGDLDDYRNWVLAIAVQVMTETKSNSTLGFGGDQVSDEEKALFADIKSAIGYEESAPVAEGYRAS